MNEISKNIHNVHGGHRNRLRKLVENAGLENLNANQIMEFILYYIIPRKDTNEMGHQLLNKFNSVYNVLSSDSKEIESMYNFGKNSAKMLAMFKLLFEFYQISENVKKVKLNNISDLVNYCSALLSNKEKYEFYVAVINDLNEIVSCRLIDSGDDEITTSKRAIYDFAYQSNCKKMFIAHNHPNGSCMPTKSDDTATEKIVDWLNKSGITLVDHIIIGNDGAFSFKHLKKINKQGA